MAKTSNAVHLREKLTLENPVNLGSGVPLATLDHGISTFSQWSRVRPSGDLSMIKASVRRILKGIRNEEVTLGSSKVDRNTFNTLVDILVKNFDCMVLVRKDGALRIRCKQHYLTERGFEFEFRSIRLTYLHAQILPA